MFKCFFMNRSLKSRITFLYSLFAVILVGVLSLYAYYFTVNLLKKKETAVLNDSIEYLEQRISTRISGVNEEFIGNFDNTSFMRLYLDSLQISNDLAERIQLDYEFQNYFFDIQVRNHDLIQSIQMITGDGTVYANQYGSRFEYENFSSSPYYAAAMENKNKIQYCDLEPESEYFSIFRSFYFLDEGEGGSAYPGVGYLSECNEDYATLLFFLKKKYLKHMIAEEAGKRETSILILDQNGRVVVQEDSPEWLTKAGYQQLQEELGRHKERGWESDLECHPVSIHAKSIDTMGWKLVYLYDMNVLYRQAGEIRHVVFWIFVLAVTAVFLIASFLSGTVVKPIESLAQSMDDAVEHQMQVSFHPKYNDEIADLGRRFHALMQRIAVLMVEVKMAEEQKRVEELKALQAQINPHFLYNTLDMLYWLAKLDGSDKIADLVADLADFFRLSLNKGEDLTTVEREVDHVRKYLEIQKVRMDGKFDYEIRMDDAVSGSLVPKLILQPFAENALIHGFEKIAYRGMITIEVWKEEEKIVFSVSDNGGGIGKEQIEELNQDNSSHSAKKGYAIGNVRDRIRLYAGADYGVWFEPEVEQGTKVKLWFPWGFRGGDKND